MKYRVLIVGAGQLGSRYLQGLAKVSMPLDIVISDVAADSLIRAEARWQEVDGHKTAHQVRYVIGLSGLPTEVDLAIVATASDVRGAVVTQLAEQVAVRYWVLEKVLAQSDAVISQIQAGIRRSSLAWVNTPRRSMRWHKMIKSELLDTGPLSMVVEGGGWGLACNAVHYLDLLAWWGDCELLDIDTNDLSPIWKVSKRSGFWEISGTLTAHFSEGMKAQLVCYEEPARTTIQLRAGDLVWAIDEAAGTAKRTDGLEITGKVPYQSEMTAPLVESILLNGRCDLPSLQDSASLHRPVLQSLMAHWNQHMPTSLTCVPIT
jgi:hypothetical protein